MVDATAKTAKRHTNLPIALPNALIFRTQTPYFRTETKAQSAEFLVITNRELPDLESHTT